MWRRAHRLTIELHQVTRAFPDDEKFGLTSQIRRSAASIGANLAEGSARKSARDFNRFVRIAFASASELENHLLVAADLGYIQRDQHRSLEQGVTQIKRMLTGLARRLMADG